MNNALRSVLDRVTAEEDLKQRTIRQVTCELSHAQERKNRFLPRKLMIATCSVALFLVVSAAGYGIYRTPVAYVSIDINPSIELGVNLVNRVVRVSSYNNDGQKVLDRCDIDNNTLKDAVAEIIANSAMEGYISQDGSSVIAIMAETNNQALGANLDRQAQAGAQDAVTKVQSAAVTLQKGTVTISARTEAQGLAISPGKLKLIQRLMELDKTATVEKYKDAKVCDIYKRIQELSPEEDQQAGVFSAVVITPGPTGSTNNTSSPTPDATESPTAEPTDGTPQASEQPTDTPTKNNSAYTPAPTPDPAVTSWLETMQESTEVKALIQDVLSLYGDAASSEQDRQNLLDWARAQVEENNK